MEDSFDYEEGFMGVRDQVPDSYFRSFKKDYRLRSLVQNIKLKKGKLLDIGCGGGMLTESLPYYYPHTSIYGCDVSATAIKYAKKMGSGSVTYGVIKNKKLPFQNNFFDVCICFDVLEHVPNVDFFLKEVKRVLKKDGSFFVIVPCEGEPFTFSWFLQKIHLGSDLTYRYIGHIHPEFTHRKVEKLLKKYGFSLEKKQYSENIFYQFCLFSIIFLPKIVLELIFGNKKATEYTNSNMIAKPKSNSDPLVVIKRNLFILWDFMMYYPMNWETIIMRNVAFASWKLHILVKKKQN